MTDRVRKIVAVVLTLVFLCGAMTLLFLLQNNGTAPSRTLLDAGWVVTHKSYREKPESLSQYVLPDGAERGDTVFLENVLPPDLPPQSVLRFRFYHSVVNVYEDGRRIYSYGQENFERHQIVGSGFHYVYLSPDAAGKPVCVQIVVSIDKSQTTFSTFELIPANYANTDFVANHALSLSIGLFLVIFGFLSVLFTLIVAYFNIRNFSFLMIGLLSFALGVWVLGYYKLLQIFSYNFSFNTILEFVCLYFAPIPFCGLLLHMNKNTVQVWKWNVLLGYTVAISVFFVVALVLHFSEIALFPQTLNFFHALVAVGILYISFSGIMYRSNMERSNMILSIGVAVFSLLCLGDVARYNLFLRLGIESGFSLMPLGILLLVLLLVLSFFFSMNKYISEQTERELLATMAYVDSLTGLFNRAKCNQVFEVLDKGDGDYAVVSIDMNGLKWVNDHLGHSAGDRLLRAFAGVFKASFNGVGTAIRMGGDEFLAIVRAEHLAELGAILEKMAALQKECKEDLPIPLEAAYGVAYRNECDNKDFDKLSEAVYHLADERMYAMKANMKSKLVRK